jgi:competence protein ComEA
MSWQSFLYGLCVGLLAAAIILVCNGRWEETPILLSTAPPLPGVRVSIQGAVATPGVYRLPPGSILLDAISEAGGLLPEADIQRVNQAAGLQDGQEIRIPQKVTSAAPAVVVPASDGRININTATAAQLDQLSGIGPALAQRIIEYREQNGPFQTVDGLLKVKGIGQALLEKIRDQLEAP